MTAQLTDMLPKLSPREIQVLSRVAAGQSDAETALDLGVSVPTVTFHVRNAIMKLQSRNRCHAVYNAAKLRMI